jgi:MFS transporter, DHA2 family, multidrug resistance protein
MRGLDSDAARGANPWLIATTVGLAAFMEVLDISIANVALEHIAGSLAATADEATWVLTSYLVTNAIVLPVSGWLASTIGRKRYLMGCIIGFSVTSFLCGTAPSLGVLIVARGLQGITGGGLQPNSQAILADTFPPEKRGQAFAAYGLAVVFAPAIGPTLGGWITDNMSWRWVFLINVPVGILLSLIVARLIEDPPELMARRKARLRAGLDLDYAGFALLLVGMGALQIMLDRGQQDDWFSSTFITQLAIVAAISLAALVVWEIRRADPIVDLRLLASRDFAVGNVLMFVLGFALLGTTVLLPLYAQTMLGYTATEAGMVISPGGFATMLVMPLVGMLTGKIDARWLIAIGLAAAALALLSMTRFDAQIDYATLAWARVYQALAIAFLFIPINTVALTGMSTAKSNNASAIINMTRNIGGSVGISVVTTLLARREQFHQNRLVGDISPFRNSYETFIGHLQHAYLAGSGSAADALREAQAQIYQMLQKQADLLSYNDAFWMLAVILAAMLPLVLLMRRPPRGTGSRGAH